MIKSLSVSSESSLPALEDDLDSVCSDELLGSQSRRWLSDILSGDLSLEKAAEATVGRDGLFVDRHFPVGELEMLPAVRWKRPKVSKKKLSYEYSQRLQEYYSCSHRRKGHILMYKYANSYLNVELTRSCRLELLCICVD